MLGGGVCEPAVSIGLQGASERDGQCGWRQRTLLHPGPAEPEWEGRRRRPSFEQRPVRGRSRRPSRCRVPLRLDSAGEGAGEGGEREREGEESARTGLGVPPGAQHEPRAAAQSRAAPRPPAPPSPPGPPGPSCPWGLPGSPARLFPTYSSSDFYRSARVISIKGRLRFSVAERSSSFHSLKVPSAPRSTPRRCRGSRAVGQAALGASPASPRPDSPGRRRVSARTILSSATARLLGFRARAESCSSHRGFCDLAGQNRYALRLADVPFPPHLRLHVTFIGFKV